MNATSIPATHSDKAHLRGFALASVMVALMLSLFLEALDQAIVGTAMPRIIASLHGLGEYTWVVTAYVLASLTMIPVVGKLSDQFGRKWFVLIGTGIFLLGSLLAGASQTIDQLIIFRALQGVGAGMGMALVGTIIGDLFEPATRAKWMSLFGIVYGVSSLTGPTIGGWLAEHGPLLGSLVTDATRWRWVFYINLPLGLIALIALLIFLPTNVSVRSSSLKGWAALRQVDFLGAILSAAASICLLLGLSLGSAQGTGWTSPQVLGLLTSGVILFALFFVVERRVAEPILPLNLFRNSVFTVSSLLALLQMMLVLGFTLYMPLFLQGVLAVSPTISGLVMTPLSLSMVASATLAGPLIGAFKRYRFIAIAGAALMVAGTFFVALMTPQTSLLQAVLFMIVVGLGTGVFFIVPTLAAQNALPASQMGVSPAATRYLGQMGATLGIAIVGTVVNSSGSFAQHLPTNESGKELLATALQHGFVAVLIFAVIALIATFFLKDVPFGANSPDDAVVEESDEVVEKELVEV